MALAMMDVRLGNERRKALLQHLMSQFMGQQQGNTSILDLIRGSQGQQGYHAMPLFGGGRGERNSFELPAAPIAQLTAAYPIPPTLQNQLGPGGYGTPASSEQSAGPGIPVPSWVNAPASSSPGVGAAPASPGPAQMSMPAVAAGSPVRRLYGEGTPDGVNWGGVTYTNANDLARYLSSVGANINSWAAMHPSAAARLGVNGVGR